MILLAKLFGIYFKNLFICIDEFVLQVPDILDILGISTVSYNVLNSTLKAALRNITAEGNYNEYVVIINILL